MSTSEDYEEIDIDAFHEKPIVKIYHKFRHHKVFSETISTNSCTFEIERPSYHTGHSKLFTEIDEVIGSRKELLKNPEDLPDRLITLKQITENKVKFMKMEKELKELEQCTFKPKTNMKIVKTSLKDFNKQQKDYTKSKNSAILKLKLQYSKTDLNRKATPIVASNSKTKQTDVYERLYAQSKFFSRLNKH